ncbi:hypothetical protein HNY73_002700 [Argiope bruennichi]|uniref:CUB domain-containing protein n=1 Tax=Argiope bruennichi TaxID=94029 RepID=A0A8T0FYP2_ARGBR|nr:hypothetical protein HNY73_002700 [Argiope bruennichi]
MYEVYYLNKFLDTSKAVISVGTYTNSSLILKGFEPSTYDRTNNTNFSVTIQIHDNEGVVVHITYLNIVGGCDSGEHIKISSRNKTATFCQRIFNPTIQPGSAYFYGTAVNISYITPSKVTGFLQLVVTGFTQGPCSSDNLFLCNSGICIWKGLACNSQDNCGDGSDENSPLSESKCQTHSFDDMSNFVPLFIALPLVLLGVTLVFYFCVRRQTEESQYDAADVIYVYQGDDDARIDETQPIETTRPKTDQGRSASIQNSEEMYHMKSRYSTDDSASDSTKAVKSVKDSS